MLFNQKEAHWQKEVNLMPEKWIRSAQKERQACPLQHQQASVNNEHIWPQLIVVIEILSPCHCTMLFVPMDDFICIY